MEPSNSRNFLDFPLFDVTDSFVIREPEVKAKGNWVGCPSVFEHNGELYLTYRIRRPRGEGRGVINRIAKSTDGVKFEDVFEINKDLLNQTPSVERSCLLHDGKNYRFYFSYVNSENNMWQIDLIEAESADQFDVSKRIKVLDGNMLNASGVKDPWIIRFGGYYFMYVSYAPLPETHQPELHSTGDAFATGLTTSQSGLAISKDGINFQWAGDVIGLGEKWDSSTTRISSITPIKGGYLAFYDGASRIEDNYEEKCGVAFSSDLKHFNRISIGEPYLVGTKGESIRYVDTVSFKGEFFFYFEKTRDDGSHELRGAKVSSFRW